MRTTRRTALSGAIALAAAWMSGTGRATTPGGTVIEIEPPRLDPVPPRPATLTNGKPGDFDFLTGEWRIRHRQPKPASDAWIEFHGEATVHRILGGVGSVEELRIPARDFSGMGLRLLDVETRIWSDFWVNAKSGVLAAPGVTGGFANGAGIFISESDDNGSKVLWAGVWDRIAADTCRWRQAVSRDDGASWKQVWLMDWQRA